MAKDRIDEAMEMLQRKLDEAHISASVYRYSALIPVICVEISWGDWKHDHLHARFIATDECGMSYINNVVTEEDGSDCYSAIQRFLVA